MKLLAALDRYYGLNGRLQLAHVAQAGNALTAPPLLALTQDQPPALPHFAADAAGSGAEDVAIALRDPSLLPSAHNENCGGEGATADGAEI